LEKTSRPGSADGGGGGVTGRGKDLTMGQVRINGGGKGRMPKSPGISSEKNGRHKRGKNSTDGGSKGVAGLVIRWARKLKY